MWHRTFGINDCTEERLSGKALVIYAVEDRTPRVYPWMNELFLVSAIAEVRSAFQSRRPLGPRVYPGESIRGLKGLANSAKI